MSWLVILGFFVIWNSVSSQPMTAINDVQEQSKTGECCPCTDKDASSNRDSLASPDRDASGNTASLASADQDASGNTASMAVSDAFGNADARASLAGLDECPCKFRDADSMGSPSVFFPSAVRAVRPFVSLEDTKEDSKPLLHPEVGLASSVLKTLKEATEEEYEEALARDAARSAVQSDTLESDGVAEESARNVVTVIVSQKQAHNDDDVMSEASHVQESRCIHSPLGKSNRLRIPAINPPNLLSDLLALPRRNPPAFQPLFDMDSSVGASNINEDFVPTRKEFSDKLNLKTSLGLPNLFSENKDGSLLDLLTISTNPKSLNDHRHVDSKTSDKMGVLKNRIPNILDSLTKSDQIKPIRSEGSIEDSDSATSNVVERYSGFTKDKNDVENINFDRKFNEPRKTLLENIQDRLNTVKLPTQSLSLQNRDTTSDLLNDILKNLQVPNLSSLLPSLKRNDVSDNKETKIQNNVMQDNNEQEDKQFTTEILDILPNVASKPNIEPIIKTENFSDDDINENETELQNNVDENAGTEILDSLPDTSDINQILEINGNNVQFDTLSQDKEFSNNPTSVDFNTVTENIDAKSNDFESIDAANLADEDTITDVLENENIPSVTNRETCDLNTPKNMDSVSDASNNLMITSSSEQEPLRSSSLPKQNFEPDIARESLTSSVESFHDNLEDDIEDELEVKEEEKKHKTKSLKMLRERLLDGLKKLRVPHTMKPQTVKNDPNELLRKEEIPELLKNNEEVVDDTKRSDNSVDNVSIDELQKMSDSLLDKEKQLIDKISQRKLNSVKPKPRPITTNYTVETGGLVEPDLQNLDLTAREAASNTDISEINNNEFIVDNIKEKENGCPTYLEQSGKDEPIQKNQTSEMSVEASEPISNVVKPSDRLTSTLFSDPVVQPSMSILEKGFIENLFNNPLSSLNTPNILNFNQRLSKDEPTNLNDDRNMFTQASTSSFKSALSPLQSLEDLDLDIFQIKPLKLTQNGPVFPKLPRLNVNTYKTKVAVPKSLALKPLKLESTLGSKKGMFGATLTLSPEKKQPFSAHNPSTLLSSPLASLPRLEDLHETMLENAHNILSTPLDVSSRNMIEDTLRSTQVLSENLRVQADNTVKNLQQNLESTLKEAKISSDGLLGNSVIGSNLLEAVSRSHNDFGDKLKGIHYDLNDRLETLRNDIADHIPTLGSSMFREGSSPIMVTQNPNSFSSNLGNKGFHSKPTSLRQSHASKLKTNSAKSSFGKTKPLVIPSASSVTTSRKFSTDKLKTTPIKTSEFKLKKEPSLSFSQSKDRSPLSIFQRQDKNTLDLKRPGFTLPFKPIKKENKVKITFSATTPQPKLKTKPLTIDKFENKPKMKASSTILKSFSRKPSTGLKSNLFRDSNLSPSEIQPTIVKAPFNSVNQAKSAEDYERLAVTTSRPVVKSWTTKPISPALGKATKGATLKFDKLKNTPKLTISPIFTLPKRDRHTLKSAVPKPLLPLAWPKTEDDEFLTKVREALKARFSELNLKIAHPVIEPKLGEPMIVDAGDMAKAASDNINVIKSNSVPMKENTSYTCKMLCTKNS